MKRPAKDSTAPTSETRAVAAALPAWVNLIPAGSVEDVKESLTALRVRLSELLFYANDATREHPENDAATLIEHILESGSAALMNANFIEDAIAKATEQGRLPEMHWRDELRLRHAVRDQGLSDG